MRTGDESERYARGARGGAGPSQHSGAGQGRATARPRLASKSDVEEGSLLDTSYSIPRDAAILCQWRTACRASKGDWGSIPKSG